MSDAYAIIAPMLSGKSTYIFERHKGAGSSQVWDSDEMVPHVKLVEQFGNPDTQWTTDQWAAWNTKRNALLKEAVVTAAARSDHPHIVVLVHGPSIAHDAGLAIAGAVLIPAVQFWARAARNPSRARLAVMNRHQVEDWLATAPGVPVSGSISQALTNFFDDPLRQP